MSFSLPEYTPADLRGNAVDQLGQFDKILDEAKAKGIVHSSPNNERETYDVESQRIRIQTMASRLFLLGYLADKIEPEDIEENLERIKSAVMEFQKEAGLKPDNWAGDITWHAMDEIVSFESDLSDDHWFQGREINQASEKAIHRGIQLRLWSLGLCEKKPGTDFITLEPSCLSDFEAIAKILMLVPLDYEAGFNKQTIRLLYDQERFVRFLAQRASDDKKSFRLNIEEEKEKEKLAERFIVNCAKIELWLLGYNVKINGKNDFEKNKGNDLYSAMKNYFINFQGINAAEAEELSERITPLFFNGILADSEEKEKQELPDASLLITREINSEEEINNAWEFIKSKGLRLWDGLKRIWGWIKRIGSRVFSFIRENLFIGFFRFASKSWKIVTRGISNIVNSVKVYINGVLHTPDDIFLFSKDMDTVVVVDKNLASGAGIIRLKNQSAAFSLACRIVALIFDSFKYFCAGFAGWARLLYTLVKEYSNLKNLYTDFLKVAAQ